MLSSAGQKEHSVGLFSVLMVSDLGMIWSKVYDAINNGKKKSTQTK